MGDIVTNFWGNEASQLQKKKNLKIIETKQVEFAKKRDVESRMKLKGLKKFEMTKEPEISS